MRRAFDQHALDGATVRAVLLDLVVKLGRLLRRRDQAARALTLTLRFPAGTSCSDAGRAVHQRRGGWAAAARGCQATQLTALSRS
ncbi:hypothetical protein AB0D65_15905 [Streptomyces griseoloalbus]|uniref:DNA polymerase Y-family little finger domain-containing protein n=1 Tax=Streptomyces griseoloalbus TaxID=67303 RepID=A0ABV3E7C6_9ACTN